MRRQTRTENGKHARRWGTSAAAGCLVFLLLAAVLGVSGREAGIGADLPVGDLWDPSWLERDWWDPGTADPARQKRLARHRQFLRSGLPADYADRHNPLSPSQVVLFEGGALYTAHCLECHGGAGMGDGESGLAVSPSPALLAFMIQTPSAVDGYLLWAISEGGAPFGTDMPSYKDRLSETEIWKVILYMRAGFPRLR